MKLSPRYDGPALLAIEGEPDDQGEVVRRQRRRLEALLADLTDDQWSTPSRCAGWTVQDVVAHLVGVNAFWEASVLAGRAGTPTRVLAAFDPAAHPQLMIEPMRSLSSRDVFEQFAASNDGFLGALDALDAEGWSTTAESPAGHVSIRMLAAHALWDAWIHERDIALPLGLAAVEEGDEIESCLRYAAAVGPALTITMSPANGADTDELAVIATDPDTYFTLHTGESISITNQLAADGTACLRGPAVDLIEALSVRAPLPTDAPDEWRRHVQGLAMVFDTTV